MLNKWLYRNLPSCTSFIWLTRLFATDVVQNDDQSFAVKLPNSEKTILPGKTIQVLVFSLISKDHSVFFMRSRLNFTHKKWCEYLLIKIQLIVCGLNHLCVRMNGLGQRSLSPLFLNIRLLTSLKLLTLEKQFNNLPVVYMLDQLQSKIIADTLFKLLHGVH